MNESNADTVRSMRSQLVSANEITAVVEAQAPRALRSISQDIINRRGLIPPELTQSYQSMRGNLWVGFLLVGGLFLGGTTLGTQLTIAGAVTANGLLVVESSSKKVQHPTGGVVGDLAVHEGDHVAAGDVVVRLDETVARANLAVIANNLDQQRARLARLTAERDGRPEITYPADLSQRGRKEASLLETLTSEQRLFEARFKAREGQRAQLVERINQSKKTIDGLGEQIVAKNREIDLIAGEMVGVRDLYAKRLTPLQRVNQLERDAARLTGERGSLVSSIAVENGRIAEAELKKLQIDQDLRSEVGRDISDASGTIRELSEKKIAAEDTLRRIDIRAPLSGVVHQLTVHTIGGVISPGEVLMMIIPDQDKLVGEVKIPPNEIDRIYPSQPVTINFTAFDRATTPRINGELTMVSSDLVRDEAAKTSYYTARIGISDAELGRLGSVKLVAGMPVEVFIHTHDRTLLSYLIKPLTDQVSRAFRDR